MLVVVNSKISAQQSGQPQATMLTVSAFETHESDDNIKIADAQADAIYTNEWESFKNDFDTKFNSLEYKIRDLRSRKMQDGKKQEKFSRSIEKLESKNIKLKMDLNDFKYEGRKNWLKKEREFNRRQNQLEKALNILYQKYRA